MIDRKSNVLLAVLALCVIVSVISCSPTPEKKLPVFGERDVVINEVDGKKVVDTLFHKIANFSFVDQDSAIITQDTFKDKIYVTDFFFTSCRTICPIMKTQMLRVYDTLKNNSDVLILSHTIDPEYDTVGLLHDFANRLGVRSDKWHFVTGVKDSIYNLAQRSYFATAMEDKSEPDGFIHSGAFLLIDKERRIRGKYDGTKEEDVNRLIGDIAILQKEYESR